MALSVMSRPSFSARRTACVAAAALAVLGTVLLVLSGGLPPAAAALVPREARDAHAAAQQQLTQQAVDGAPAQAQTGTVPRVLPAPSVGRVGGVTRAHVSRPAAHGRRTPHVPLWWRAGAPAHVFAQSDRKPAGVGAAAQGPGPNPARAQLRRRTRRQPAKASIAPRQRRDSSGKGSCERQQGGKYVSCDDGCDFFWGTNILGQKVWRE